MSQYQPRLSSITNVVQGRSANHITVFTSNQIIFVYQISEYFSTIISFCLLGNIAIQSLNKIFRSSYCERDTGHVKCVIHFIFFSLSLHFPNFQYLIC